MKSFIAIASLAVGVNAFVGRSDSCCFHLTASGDVSGSLSQLKDGQVRVGDNSLSPARFCIAGGVVTDSEGRGCIVTSETTQFQCNAGSAGTSGFSLSSSGGLEFNGKTSFVACATGQNNGDNIYTTQGDSVTQCVSVKLMADSTCAGPSSSAISSGPVATSMPASSSSIPASSPAPSGSSPVGSGSGSSSSAAARASSTPVAGSSNLVTKTSSSAMVSSGSAAATGASSATSASSTVAPASSSVAASAASKFDMGNFATAMVVLSMASLYLI